MLSTLAGGTPVDAPPKTVVKLVVKTVVTRALIPAASANDRALSPHRHLS